MKKFYIIGMLVIILLPLLANATHIFGAEIAVTVASHQSNIEDITFIRYEYSDLGAGLEVESAQAFFTLEETRLEDSIPRLRTTEAMLSTGEEEEKPKVQLYPNPTQGDFTLDISDDIWLGANASIHNIIGQEMDQRTVTLGENAYNITDYQQGIYFLTLQQGELQNVIRFVKR